MNVTSAQIAPVSAAGTSSPPDENGAPTSDFETFLTLLTTQLKNQDPLKPLESTEFVAQLASFSAVEQQVRTNDVLGRIENFLSGAAPSDLASWIGIEVQAVREAVFDGTPVDVIVDPADGAERAEMIVLNSAGQEVQRLTLDPGQDVVTWAGVQPDGSPFSPGSYRFEVESFQGTSRIDTHQGAIYARVREARLVDGATVLVLDDGVHITTEQVLGVREGSL